MRIIAVIPARYASSRLPGKPLMDICGKPMIQHVWEKAKQAAVVDEVVVAADDARIAAAVNAFGGRTLMTSPECASGSDRLLEVARREPADIYINIQGDEPLLRPEAVTRLAQILCADESLSVGTLCCRVDAAAAQDPNLVKVVCDGEGNALYFSRSPVPFVRDAGEKCTYLAHIGVYAYRASALARFGALPPSPLEKLEKLEQLRLLQAGIGIRVLETEAFGPGVDTEEDLAGVRRILGGLMQQRNIHDRIVETAPFASGGDAAERPDGVRRGPGKSSAPEAAGRSGLPAAGGKSDLADAGSAGQLSGKEPSARDAVLRKVKLVITDVDGVLTDGGLFYGAEGEALKRFHARDGMGIKLLQKAGIQVAVLSGRDSRALRARMRDLEINLFELGQTAKQEACARLMSRAGVSAEETLFLGDDVPDSVVFQVCALGVAVADAPGYVKERADWVLDIRGGDGAFREVSDAVLAAQGRADLLAPARDLSLARMDGFQYTAQSAGAGSGDIFPCRSNGGR